ncbi:NADH-dependent [FeFe] hydrogenase, group A6 [Proteinivorax hydrogeniformans]|uniref:NADH-dependent [FeFe] hydrogenase, group A6 n=1 Tax=Proteinivorax hydrogeniformans TaxID=1826727 RepID=A0AAU8HTI1_9FIRM
MATVRLTINGKNVVATEDNSILDVCKKNGVNIPTLCTHPDLNDEGNCRMCVVEVDGEEELLASCNTKVKDKMVVRTETERIKDSRKATLELLIANHPNDCLTCDKVAGDCELQNLCYQYDVNRKEQLLETLPQKEVLDLSSTSITRDINKCIVCGNCVRVCSETQDIGIYDYTERGHDTVINTKEKEPISETDCINCGQCIKVCPVGALVEKNDIHRVRAAINDPNVHVVVQTAPAVKHTLGEEFGLEPGTDVTGQTNAALRKLGADKVFSTDFTADLTIMEEGTEFIDRIQKGEKLPLLTSCSPGWVKYVEHNHPRLLENVSSCKSPQQMFGALSKSYYAEINDLEPQKIFSLSIMPCTAKKFEADREELKVNDLKDVDAVLTTRELAKMIKMEKIQFAKLDVESFDNFLGDHTSAGRIFGTTGGVMEAALRTVAWKLSEGKLDKIEYEGVRGLTNAKEAEIKIADMKVKIAVVHGTAAAKELMKKIENGEKQYHFVEIMGCIGGCINGGGAPIPDSMETVKKRMAGIYKTDGNSTLRRSHENPLISKLYDNYLGQPGGHKAHDLLHTHYIDRSTKNVDVRGEHDDNN